MNSHVRNSTSFAFCSILFLASGNMAVAQSCPEPLYCSVPPALIPDLPTAYKTGESVAIDGEYAVVGSGDMRCATVGQLGCGAAHVYRMVNNQWTLQTRLIPSDEATIYGDYGESVAISGNFAFIGHRMNDLGGGPNLNYGAVYIFERVGTQWIQHTKLLAPVPVLDGWFGERVAASGDRLVVGASHYGCANGEVCGAAFVYRRNGAFWQLEQNITPGLLPQNSAYGLSVAISGTTIAVGASRMPNSSGITTGAVFVYQWNGSQWFEQGRIFGNASIDGFGLDVALSGNRLVVVADGTECNDGQDCGQGYLYERVNNAWVFRHALIPMQSQAGDWLKNAAMDEDFILLGSMYHDCPIGNQCGVVYVFREYEGLFQQVAQIVGPQGNELERFGRSIAINAGRIMIGAENYRPTINWNWTGGTFFIDAAAFGCNCDATSCAVKFESPYCDENARVDVCELEDRDCNGNLRHDSCDIRFGNSTDNDFNSIPDECACLSVAPIAAEVSGINKNRFLSFSPGNPGHDKAIRVTLRSLHHVVPPYNGGPTVPFTSFEGEVRWVGPPDLRMEHSTGGTFLAAQLQCDPHFQDWSAYDILHVTGSAIVPSSEYDVQIVGANCNLADEGSYSPALLVRTTRWSDVEIPLDPPSGTTQPDLADVSALINKFRNAPGAPIKARALLAGDDAFGNITSIDPDLNFTHISVAVDAFRGRPYPYAIQACP